MDKRVAVLMAVLGSGLAVAITNSVAFFIGIANQPPGTVYLGTTHYWEDYFFYLNHFFQGAHGAWIPANRFTGEATPAVIHYWYNVLLGKIGSLLFLSPPLSYNISILLLCFATLVLSFLLLRKITRSDSLAMAAFVFTTFSTSMINIVTSNEGKRIFWPFQIWGTPHFAFDRLGGAPHHLLRTGGFYLLVLLILTRPQTERGIRIHRIALVVTGLAYATINPIQTLMFLSVYGVITLIANRRKAIAVLRRNEAFRLAELLPFSLVALASFIGFLMIIAALNAPPHSQAKAWEAAQHSYTTFPFLLLSIGPILPFGLVGILSRVRRLTTIELTGLVMYLAGYAVFLSRIPQAVGVSNLRILFPSNQIFLGLMAAYGADTVARWIRSRLGTPGKFPVRTVSSLLPLAVFLLLSLPTLAWEIGQRTGKPVDQRDITQYMPAPLYEACLYLQSRLPYDAVVLANPDTHLDTMVPALTGHTSWSGHIVQTLNNGEKQQAARAFISQSLPAQSAQQFLTDNRIGFVLYSDLDGDPGTVSARYPFLTVAFRSSGATVFEVTPLP